jgi:hypothetical protein
MLDVAIARHENRLKAKPTSRLSAIMIIAELIVLTPAALGMSQQPIGEN